MRLTHHNDTTTKDEVIYNQSMGAVVYRNTGFRVVYQGRGVFVAAGDGSTVVTPPEFRHREETLTPPLVRIRDSDLTGGGRRTTVIVQRDNLSVYPNATASSYDCSGDHPTLYVNFTTTRLSLGWKRPACASSRTGVRNPNISGRSALLDVLLRENVEDS